MNDVLRVEDLFVSFSTPDGEVKAVNGVSFSLKEESIFCLVGESGAGKTATALTLMSLLPRSASVLGGKVCFRDMDLLTTDPDTLRQIRGNEICMIPQEPRSSLNPTLTVGLQVEEQILAHTDLSKREATRLAVETLRDMGLPDPKDLLKRYPFEISGGMCQRVLLSMALALRPKVLIADEVTSNLDVTLQAEILDRLKVLCKQLHASLILITHDLGVVAHMADEVAVMYAGSIVEAADVHILFQGPRHPYTWGLFQSMPRLDQEVQRIPALRGNPPDLMNLSDECPYIPRCPKATATCQLKRKPPLEEMTVGHRVACYNPIEYHSLDEEA